MINWLKKRLSPVKKDSSRWKELAEAIQEFWAENFDPDYDVIANLRSIYTADSTNQKKLLVEIGPYFEDGIAEENIPVSTAMRKMELHQKETDIPLVRAMVRLGVVAEWKPLYVLPDADYGDAFYTNDQVAVLGESVDNCLLTSRGVLVIDMSSVPISEDTANLAVRRCRSLLPLHIVFDRCRLYASLSCNNMPKIAIGEMSSETTTVNPYTLASLEVSTARTRIVGGSFGLETVEVRPQ
jgi:hypothetical protein